MKIVNKKTGEVIDLSSGKKESKETKKPTSEFEKFEERSAQSEKKIKERGTIQQSVEKVKGKSTLGKLSGAAELASSPLSAIESGIANPMLAMQKGNFTPKELVRQAIEGFTLQRQGQFGDVYKNAGFNPILSDTAGLLLMLSPVRVADGAAKTFGNISKMSDKGLNKAGKKIITATMEAKTAVGKKVGEQFAKYADNISVDGMKFIDAVAGLPKTVVNKLEVAFGNLDDFAQGLNVKKLREFKTYLGKLRPNDFGKSERGVAETIDVIDLKEGYGKVKGLMWNTIEQSGLDKKAISGLRALDNTYSNVVKASSYIKKQVVDSTTRTSSKVGSFADKVTKGTDTTSRLAVNEIKRASSRANKFINQAMDEIRSFERWKAIKGASAHVARAIAYGGVAGGIGGRILSKASDRD